MGEVILKHLTKRFGEVVAVDDVSLFIEDGEFLVLLGPSGCGKSTILRLIAGLEDSSSGEIMIGGKLVNFIDPVRRNVAMVFQNYALYPHMTVYKNIGFPLEMAKKDKATIQRAVTSAAEVLELGDLLQRHPDQLSGGQRQRVALARAIVREPQAFLMDEPLSNLDALLRVQTRVELMRLHQRLRTTTIYVTHDQVEAMTMGHRVVVMQHGVVQQVGKPDDVYNRPANVFVATFIGSPPMNLLPGTLVRDGGGWVFRGDGFSVPIDPVALGVDDTALERAAGEGSKLGVRPESMRLGEPGDAGIPAKIQLLEPVGSDLFLTVEVGPATMQVRTPPETPASPGQAVTLLLPPSKLHVFGPDGRSVRYSEAEAPPAETAIESTAAAPAEQPA